MTGVPPTSRGLDLQRVRADTPSCARRLHLNNAGASPSPAPVAQVMAEHLALEAEIGGYAAEEAAAGALAGFYDSAARLIGARPHEIAFAESATQAWRLAFHAIAWRPSDRILTSRCDYASNMLAFIRAEERFGVRVEFVPNDESGGLDVSALAEMMDDRVALVAVTHAAAHSGLLNPVEEIGAVVRQGRALYLIDACQSLGQAPFDAGAIGCHLLSATGRKFLRGPRGTGFLHVADAVLDRLAPVFIDLHSARWTGEHSYQWARGAARFESWESPVAAKLGLGAAIDYALDIGLDVIAARNTALAGRLRAGLAAIPAVTLADSGRARSAIVTFTPRRGSAEEMAAALGRAGVSVTSLSAASALIDFKDRGLTGVVRASPHYFNTEAEIDAFCALVAEMADAARTPAVAQ